MAIAVLLGVAAFVIVNRDRGCGEDTLALHVTASPDIQPAITEIADGYNRTERRVDGRCVQVTVKKEEAPSVANAISGSGATIAEGIPDLWIPDSGLWLGQLRAKGVQVPEPAGSIARSPIVLVAPSSAVDDLRRTLDEVSWAGLVAAANVAAPDGPGKKIRVLAPDPLQNAAGLGALLAASGVLREADQEDQLIGALKRLSRSLARSPDALLASLQVRSRRAPLGVASEHDVWVYNTTEKPTDPIMPLYPVEGTLNLDYPAVIMTRDAALVKAAEDFVDRLAAPPSQAALRAAGFRTAGGKADPALTAADGFAAEAPDSLPDPSPNAVASMTQSWSRLNLGTRLLALYDVSGTMALPVPGTGADRMRVISQIAAEGLKLFPPDSEIGAWEFSTHMDGQGVDYVEKVPVGPLSEEVNGVLRRDLLQRHLAGIKAKPTGDTGLNDTLAAAYERMTEEYQPDKINTLLVLTDGAGNDDPDGGLSDAELLNKLQSMYDETKPVSILIIAFGPDAPKGRKTMDRLVKATGGELFIAKDVLEVRKFFLEGMKRRLCSPHCDS